jgi:hypothetical protein
MQNQGKQKTDSYIKNQNMRLKEMRLNILLKILCVIVPLAILMAVPWGIMSINPSPEKWEQKQITYSNISRERVARRSTYVLYTTDGDRYILGTGTEETELLSQQLIPNQQYRIVYSENLFTKITQSLSSPDKEFIELEKSVAEWEHEQKTFQIVCVIMICLMLVGSVMCYAFWCKKERQEIKKIKAKISARLSKIIM